MNIRKIGVAFAALAVTVSAHAAVPVVAVVGGYDSETAGRLPPTAVAPMEKTRSEVRQELERARQSGELDALRKLYSGR
ncbi:MAG: DUF4148 domain-containing protein [Burkholderia sp.]|jgi:hypothetical protein|uniref:DUF4148 domain-containing protein n=1 Tax=Burkholderia sp. TaxID=36773 RepID=UPI00282AD820|nr:DUF4148 domain-containing protein [Burkholderia sp.]MDR0243340.1 DUF4148 domain-containing protein [Burkholderia sp.]